MRIGGIGSSGSARFETRRASESDSAATEDTTANGRALVAVTPAPRVDPTRHQTHRPTDARVIAQLLATRDGAPQTRARRRGSIEEALAAYAAGPFRNTVGLTRAVA
jgi:hypothetical protein